MCGRFSLGKPANEIAAEFAPDLWPDCERFLPGFNIAPTMESPVLLHEASRVIRLMRWGLVPFWAKERQIGNRLINARSETLTEKPSFRHLVEQRRCAVIAHGYFEWRPSPQGKLPFFIHRDDGRLLTFAGLWDIWHDPADGTCLHTYTIITTSAAPSLAHLHQRMPAILPDAESREQWLDITQTPAPAALALLQPCEHSLTFFQVSTNVNSVRYDAPDCVERADSDFLL